jgi:hypothetical protein
VRSLCLNNHLLVTMFAPGGRGTRRQVSLSISALYSSAITMRQLVLVRALRQFVGMGEVMEAEKSKRWTVRRDLACERVTGWV